MLRALLFGTSVLLIVLTSSAPALAQNWGEINEAVGYVNLVQTTTFAQGDDLAGACRATAHPPETVTAEMFYYVRARLIDWTATPVSDWETDGEFLLGGQSAELVPPVSQYAVPATGFVTAYTYEVQHWVIPPQVPGQPPPAHWEIEMRNVYFSN